MYGIQGVRRRVPCRSLSATVNREMERLLTLKNHVCVIAIDGMTCNSCVELIRHGVLQLHGVNDIHVSDWAELTFFLNSDRELRPGKVYTTFRKARGVFVGFTGGPVATSDPHKYSALYNYVTAPDTSSYSLTSPLALQSPY